MAISKKTVRVLLPRQRMGESKLGLALEKRVATQPDTDGEKCGRGWQTKACNRERGGAAAIASRDLL
jgi:hypothetical protein